MERGEGKKTAFDFEVNKRRRRPPFQANWHPNLGHSLLHSPFLLSNFISTFSLLSLTRNLKSNMSFTNWLSLPLSTTDSPLPIPAQTPQSPNYSMELVNDVMNSSLFQYQNWNTPAQNALASVPSADYFFPTEHENFVPTEHGNIFQPSTLSLGSSMQPFQTSAHTSTNTIAATIVDAPPTTSYPLIRTTSIYRGVTKHKWTGRWEAHFWDSSVSSHRLTKRGRQIYLGGYDQEEEAARAYDLAALKYCGTSTPTNFSIINYVKELKEMRNLTRQEVVASIRRNSTSFARGTSKYRGVTRHHTKGKWQARLGKTADNKELYLGTFYNEEEAARVYDVATIIFKGPKAVTNFDRKSYDIKAILKNKCPQISAQAIKRVRLAWESKLHLGCDYSSTSTLPTFPHIQLLPLMQPQLIQQPLLTLPNTDDIPINTQADLEINQSFTLTPLDNSEFLHGVKDVDSSFVMHNAGNSNVGNYDEYFGSGGGGGVSSEFAVWSEDLWSHNMFSL